MCRARHKAGFTLVEILIVVAIVGVLAMLAGWGVMEVRQKARINQAQIDLAQLHEAIKELMWDTGYWPGGKEKVDKPNPGTELWDLADPRSGLMENVMNFPHWDGPYIEEVKKDPWGRPYFMDPDYYPNGMSAGNPVPAIGSFGPSGTGKTDYDSNNIWVEISP
jgi:general secretion pathway protein G